ncbi:adenylate cyclase [Klebsormidium nitens]|uniref:Adenylate cyclase n=1 Tax=Klebsormidium nitens TaxID=105231 RepID=A0A1Y1I7L7_KLENI|nr:adenylate cyclase [Klebsormidium nitens]|eukprot:GAQ84098.1 adenylate cyclase [Klebsormidium nitens]
MKQLRTLRDFFKGDSCFLKLTEDILVQILVDGQLSVRDIARFAASGRSCRKFVNGSARLWLELLRRDFPKDEVSNVFQEHVRSLQGLFKKRDKAALLPILETPTAKALSVRQPTTICRQLTPPMTTQGHLVALFWLTSLVLLCPVVVSQPQTAVTLCSGQAGACVARNGNLPEFPWDARCACLTKVVNLTLVEQGITRLPVTWASPGAFPELRLLNLTSNSIAELPVGWGAPGAFPKLAQLWVSYNRVQMLPMEWGINGAFPTLVELRLGTNEITSLPDAPAGSLPFFPTLQTLTFPRNRITGSLPASWGRRGAFSQLQQLYLAYNRISAIPASWGVSGSFPQLLDLDLDDNGISALPETWGTGGGFPKLESLTLDQNRIAAFPASWTTNTTVTFPSLQLLTVADNQLTSLPDNWGSPSALRSLQILSLDGNRIAALPSAWGIPLRFPLLGELFLSRNAIAAVPATWTTPGAFPLLQNLVLDNNRLTEAPAVSSGATWRFLISLSLSGNRIAELPASWGARGVFLSLLNLDLGNNSLTRLPPAWPSPTAFASLSNLDISGGQLESLPDAWFANGSLSDLFVLDASGNRISALPSAWGIPGRVCNVVDLNLADNKIAALPPNWGLNDTFPYLFKWNLSNNQMEELPASFSDGRFDILWSLDLAGNRIRTLPTEWGFDGAFRTLVALNVSRNNVTKIPDSWAVQKSGNRSFAILDELKLSDTPALAGRKLESVLPGFWTKCIESGAYGCAVNFLGSNLSTHVSADVKRQVCFGNITVLFRGPPGYELPRRPSKAVGGGLVPIVQFDEIDLGPEGVHLTGLRFPPRPGNLCRNARAALVIGLMWGGTGGALLLGVIVLRVRHAFKSFEAPASGGARAHSWHKGARLFLFGLGGAAWHVVDLALDARVLRDVWIQPLDTWVKWVLLAFIVAQYAIAGLFLGASWWAGAWRSPRGAAAKPRANRSPVGFHWWLVADYTYSHTDAPASVSITQFCWAVATWPFAAAAAVILDAAAIVLRLGVHPVVGGKVVSLDAYVAARGLIEELFEAVPQAILQSALYLLGNSAATNYYIDDAIFIPSLVWSLMSLLKCLLGKYRDALAIGSFAPKAVWHELRNMCPLFIDRADARAQEANADEGDSELKDLYP